MKSDSECSLMLLHFAQEFEHEAFKFNVSNLPQQKQDEFLSEFNNLIDEGFIEREKSDAFGAVYFRVSEDGHQKVAEFMKAVWSECLPLFEEAFRKYNQ